MIIAKNLILCTFTNPSGLPLDHGRKESYLLMNLESEKCLDYSDGSYAVFESDCNPSTVKRWKLISNDGGKQLCDETPAIVKCVFSPTREVGLAPILILQPMNGQTTSKGKFRKYTQYVSVVGNQIRFPKGRTQMNAVDPILCAATTKLPDPGHNTTVALQPCSDNYNNQTWFFVSF